MLSPTWQKRFYKFEAIAGKRALFPTSQTFPAQNNSHHLNRAGSKHGFH
jgi:hypothetical protein